MSSDEQKKLFEQFYPCILNKAKYHAGVIARSCRRFSDERDFVQELVWKAFCEISKFEPQKASFMTFISAVMTHDCFDMIRNLKARKRNIVTCIDNYSDLCEIQIDDNCLYDCQQSKEMAEFINNIPPPADKICRLFINEQKTVSQIAKIMGLKNSTVRTLLKKTMRPYLEYCHHAQ